MNVYRDRLVIWRAVITRTLCGRGFSGFVVRTQSILVYRNCKCTEPTAPRTCPCSLGAMPMLSPRGSHLSFPPPTCSLDAAPHTVCFVCLLLPPPSSSPPPPLLLLLRQPACPELGGRGLERSRKQRGAPGVLGLCDRCRSACLHVLHDVVFRRFQVVALQQRSLSWGYLGKQFRE